MLGPGAGGYPRDGFEVCTAHSCSVSTCGAGSEACTTKNDCEAADDTGNLTWLASRIWAGNPGDLLRSGTKSFPQSEKSFPHQKWSQYRFPRVLFLTKDDSKYKDNIPVAQLKLIVLGIPNKIYHMK